MATRVRFARAGEEAELLRLYEWLFAEPGRRPAGWDSGRAIHALREAIAGEESAVLVAEDSGEAVGLCTAYLDLRSVRFGLRCWIEDLVVESARRSQGVGGALIDAVADWAREGGATHLELDTDLARTDAQRFYQRRDPDAVGYSYSWAL